MSLNNLSSFYKNKKILITGASGFKGSWLSLCLTYFNADVLGYSLKPDTNPSMFLELKINRKIKNIYGDILNKEKLEKTLNEFNPDIIFHLAAQPLVRLSYSKPLLTYETNIIGTLNVLEAARKCSNVKAFVNITTDKCYENRETDRGYKEDDPMGGYDMYSSSKACSEILSASYRNSFLKGNKNFALATARSGNVIGGGDWSLDRLIPDCICNINNNKPIEIRSPNAVRPWQHVLEPLAGYLMLGEMLFQNKDEYSTSFNFGPKQSSVLKVSDVVNKVIEYYGKGKVVIKKKDSLHEANLLMLNINKAKKVLNWSPKYSVEKSIYETVEWYKKFYAGENIMEFSINQIKEYFT